MLAGVTVNAVACPGAASRAITDCLAGRSRAAYCCPGRYAEHRGFGNLWATRLVTVSAVLRPSECNGVELESAKMKRIGMERVQTVESGQRCAGTVPSQPERGAEPS